MASRSREPYNYGGGYVEDVFGLAVAQLDASESEVCLRARGTLGSGRRSRCGD